MTWFVPLVGDNRCVPWVRARLIYVHAENMMFVLEGMCYNNSLLFLANAEKRDL